MATPKDYELAISWEELRMGSWHFYCSRQFFESHQDWQGAYLHALNNNGHLDLNDGTRRNMTIEKRVKGILVTNDHPIGAEGRASLQAALRALAGAKTV